MEEGTYKGDSPGKRIARARLWISMSNWMNAIGSSYLGSLVLAGHGGDFATLEGLGFDLTRVTGIDCAESEATYTQSLYQNAHIIHGDCAQVVAQAQINRGMGNQRHWKLLGNQPLNSGGVVVPNNAPAIKVRKRQHSTILQVQGSSRLLYNSGHLDFCNGIGGLAPTTDIPNMVTLGEAMLGASAYPAIFGVTLLKGRECAIRDRELLVPNMPRATRKKARDLYRKCGMEVSAACFTHGEFDPRKMIALAEKRLRRVFPHRRGVKSVFQPVNRNGNLTAIGKAMTRAETTRQIMNVYLFGTGLECTLLNVYAYHSGEHKAGKKTPGGTPFCSFVLCVGPRQAGDQIEIAVRTQPQLMQYHSVDLTTGEEAIKHYALDLLRAFPRDRVVQILDMHHKRNSLAAWKAHQTMGSYAKEEQQIRKKGCGFNINLPSAEQRHTYGWGDLYIGQTRGEDGLRTLTAVPIEDLGVG